MHKCRLIRLAAGFPHLVYITSTRSRYGYTGKIHLPRVVHMWLPRQRVPPSPRDSPDLSRMVNNSESGQNQFVHNCKLTWSLHHAPTYMYLLLLGRYQSTSPHRQPEETPRTLSGQSRPLAGREGWLWQRACNAEGHGVPKDTTSLCEWAGAHPRGGGFPNETGGHSH